MIRLLLDMEPLPTSNMNMPVVYKDKASGKYRAGVRKTAEAEQWLKVAQLKLQQMKAAQKLHTIEGPVAMSMDVWRPRNAGDLDNYYKGVCDALQAAEIVRNDKQIVEHRRCRVRTDPRRPRYEILLFPLEAQGVLIPLDAEPDPIIPDCFKLANER